ncbi:MAG: HAMP domain-containing histidine kinase [Proteobacteria bacterium]|nr:HAMP domain-containing histidine kinase [Pseudomonadota bacterium]
MEHASPSIAAANHRSLRRITHRVAAIIGLATALAIPAGFLGTAIHYQRHHLMLQAELVGERLAAHLALRPATGQIELDKLVALVPIGSDANANFAILDPGGNVVAAAGADLGALFLSHRAALNDGAQPIGWVEAREDLGEVLNDTALAALFGLTIAAALYISLRVLLLRALDRTLNRLTDVQSSAGKRVAELQETKIELEIKGLILLETVEKLSDARDRAEAANRAKSRFLANMSHELRTPLNAIIGFSDLIRSETFGPVGTARYRDYAKDIFDSGSHLLTLINDLLDISKAEAGKLDLHDEDVDAASLVEQAFRLVAQQASDTGLSLLQEVPAGWAVLRVDERYMRQVIINLVSNAVKFTAPGGSVRVTAERREGGRMAITVRDTGIGMAAEMIPKALSAFGQIDNPFTRQAKGTGLGLPLAKTIVEAHGGELAIDSEPGRGTAVSVVLPRERVVRVGAAARPAQLATAEADFDLPAS